MTAGHRQAAAASAAEGACPSRVRRSASRDIWAAAALILVWLTATAWVRPLSQPDEGRYVGVAWEMLRSGDWLTPTLNGLPFFHKPPLFYWITAASMSLFGPNEFAARVAPILGASLGAFALYVFTRRWTGVRAARLTLLALLVQPLFYIGGQFANLDMLVAGCIGATILLLADATLCIERGLPHRSALAAAYVVAALGVLSKGLIGVAIPALVIVTWLVWLRRARLVQSLASPAGIGLFALIAAPWFIAMQQRFADFTNYFFIVQQFKRYTMGGFNNVEPFWFYPAVLLVFSLPCLPWLYISIMHSGPRVRPRSPLRTLMWLWVAVVVVFFSIPQSKLLGYILPAVPPLAFLMADGFLVLRSASPGSRRIWWASLAVAMLLSVGAVVRYAIQPLRSSRELALTLAAQRGPHEPVLMLNRYYYDVPFYARLRDPVEIVDDWSSPEIRRHDDWHKEFTDAAQFASARSAAVLIDRAALPSQLCRAPVSWVIGATSEARVYRFLSRASVVYSGHNASLWRVEPAEPSVASALDCAASANARSTAK